MTKFIHADFVELYAQDAQECAVPWKYWQYLCLGVWYDCTEPIAFQPHVKYRRKPKTILINGFEVPEPVREPLINDQQYWITDVRNGAAMWKSWCNDEYDRKWLAAGLIHLTKEAAQQHIDALLSFTRRDK